MAVEIASRASDGLPLAHTYFNGAAERFLEMGSPFYAALSDACAKDDEILELAAHARPGQPATHLLFGAVQFLLSESPDHPLAGHYRSSAERPFLAQDVFEEFRSFCRANRDRLAALLSTRTVQTTVPRRAALLLPAVALLSERVGAPLSIVEVGCSAGLLTLFDHYCYDLDTETLGEASRPLISAVAYNGAPPPWPAKMPEIRARVGIDLNPIDPTDAVERRWVDAILPPDLVADRRELRIALDYRATVDLPVLKGDALHIMPRLLPDLMSPVCVIHSHCLYQWPQAAKEAFEAILVDASKQRNIFRISIENSSFSPIQTPRSLSVDGRPLLQDIQLVTYRDGTVSSELLGHCDGWGRNAAWLAPT